jgi:hypothetical protein
MFVCCECCVLSGRGLCDGLITRPQESYRMWRVVLCDQETFEHEESKFRYRALEITGCPKKIVPFLIFFSRCPVCGEWCKLH